MKKARKYNRRNFYRRFKRYWKRGYFKNIRRFSYVRELCTPVIFANVKLLSFVKKSFQSTSLLHGIDKLDQIVTGKINVLNLWKEGVDLNFGVSDPKAGEYAIRSFVAATKALKEGFVDVLVTAPINKYNIQSDEFKFPGHTDYLDQELEGNALMLMVQDNLRVGLLTVAQAWAPAARGPARRPAETGRRPGSSPSPLRSSIIGSASRSAAGVSSTRRSASSILVLPSAARRPARSGRPARR